MSNKYEVNSENSIKIVNLDDEIRLGALVSLLNSSNETISIYLTTLNNNEYFFIIKRDSEGKHTYYLANHHGDYIKIPHLRVRFYDHYTSLIDDIEYDVKQSGFLSYAFNIARHSWYVLPNVEKPRIIKSKFALRKVIEFKDNALVIADNFAALIDENNHVREIKGLSNTNFIPNLARSSLSDKDKIMFFINENSQEYLVTFDINKKEAFKTPVDSSKTIASRDIFIINGEKIFYYDSRRQKIEEIILKDASKYKVCYMNNDNKNETGFLMLNDNTCKYVIFNKSTKEVKEFNLDATVKFVNEQKLADKLTGQFVRPQIFVSPDKKYLAVKQGSLVLICDESGKILLQLRSQKNDQPKVLGFYGHYFYVTNIINNDFGVQKIDVKSKKIVKLNDDEKKIWIGNFYPGYSNIIESDKYSLVMKNCGKSCIFGIINKETSKVEMIENIEGCNFDTIFGKNPVSIKMSLLKENSLSKTAEDLERVLEKLVSFEISDFILELRSKNVHLNLFNKGKNIYKVKFNDAYINALIGNYVEIEKISNLYSGNILFNFVEYNILIDKALMKKEIIPDVVSIEKKEVMKIKKDGYSKNGKHEHELS